MQMLLPSGSKIIAMRQTGVDSDSMRNFTSCLFKWAMAASKSTSSAALQPSGFGANPGAQPIASA